MPYHFQLQVQALCLHIFIFKYRHYASQLQASGLLIFYIGTMPHSNIDMTARTRPNWINNLSFLGTRPWYVGTMPLKFLSSGSELLHLGSVGRSVCGSVGQKNVKNCQKSVKTCQKHVKTCQKCQKKCYKCPTISKNVKMSKCQKCQKCQKGQKM